MYSIKEVIIVEGRYDKNTLSQIVDAVIIETSGFGIFNDRQKQKLIRTMAEKHGLIVLTDSDGAGFVIRSFISSCVPPELVKHAFIPDVHGKEKRKAQPSREGKLGVEGMPPEILLEALRRAGATVGEGRRGTSEYITKADLYALGLSGRENSAAKRASLVHALDLPEHIGTNALLDVLNAIMDKEELISRAALL